MDRPQSRTRGRPDLASAEVVDFDEALLTILPAALQAELRAEAEMLAAALAPDRARSELMAMADALSRGSRDSDQEFMADRRRARGLAAALRLLARRSEA